MRYLLLTCSLLVASLTLAQGNSENGAFAGGSGIFVFISDNIYRDNSPNKGVTAIRLERKAAGENNFQAIATLQSPADAGDFVRRFDKALADMPFDLPGLKGKGPAIWELYSRHCRFDSLGAWKFYLPVQAAFGLVYYDKSAKSGVSYTYQLVQLERGQPGKTIAFNPTSWPGKASFGKIEPVDSRYDGGQLYVRWGGKKSNWPKNFAVLRQDKLGGAWRRITGDISTYSSRDSMYVEAWDNTVVVKNIYRYALIPSDHYGNPGDTIFSRYAGAYDYTQVAPPFQRIGTGLSADAQAVTLSWNIEDATMVSGIRLFRSADRDGPYDTLATLPPNAIGFVDEGAAQMQMAHYYLQCIGPLGENGPHSPRFFALPDQSYTPVAPTLISANGTKNGVELLIQGNDVHAKGYRIFRQADNISPMLPITDLLTPGDAGFRYVDTATSLSGKRSYGYCVVAEGKGFAQSIHSDTLFARPQKATVPPVPTGLSSLADLEAIRLYWDNMEAADETVSAYVVHRRELPNGKWAVLNESILTVEQNNYEDHQVSVGKRYAYAVECYDYYGGKSGLSDAVEAGLPVLPVLPPGGITAHKVDGGIAIACDITLQDGLKGYNLYRYQRGSAPKKIATLPPADIILYTDKQVTAGQLYFYYFTISLDDGRESKAGEEVGVRN